MPQLNCPPRLSPVYASLCTSRYPVQDSGPSRSLVLSRKNFSFSASSRFSPAHKHPDFTHPMKEDVKKTILPPPLRGDVSVVTYIQPRLILRRVIGFVALA